jgi:hypothetical protein
MFHSTRATGAPISGKMEEQTTPLQRIYPQAVVSAKHEIGSRVE